MNKIVEKDIKELSGEALQDWLVDHWLFNLEFCHGVSSNYNVVTECRLSSVYPERETVKAKKSEIIPLIEFNNDYNALSVKKSVKEAVSKRREAEKKRREEADEIDRLVKKIAELKAKGIDIDALG